MVLSSKDQVVTCHSFYVFHLTFDIPNSACHVTVASLCNVLCRPNSINNMPVSVCMYRLTCRENDIECIQCIYVIHLMNIHSATLAFFTVMESPFQLASILKLRGHCSHLGGPMRNVYLRETLSRFRTFNSVHIISLFSGTSKYIYSR